MTETNNRPVAESFMNRRYEIPYYQRSFVWGEDEIGDLLDDIDFAYDQNVSHYLGNIVLDEFEPENEDAINHYYIIDGQQRLTALSMVFASIYHYVEGDVRSDYAGEVPDNIQEKIKRTSAQCQDMFLVQTAYGLTEDNITVGKEIQDEDERQVFNEIIQNHYDNRDIDDATGYSASNMKNVSKVIWNWILSIEENSESNEETLDELYSRVVHMKKNFNLTEYVVQDDSEAGRIFGVLNDRGKDLNAADKIKSTLIYKASTPPIEDKELVEDIHRTFSDIYELIAEPDTGRQDVTTFIRNHWFIFTGAEYSTSAETLHREMKREPHVHKDRPCSEQVYWIESYLKSLRNTAFSKVNISNYGKTLDKEKSSVQDLCWVKNNEREMELDTIRYYVSELLSKDFNPLLLTAEMCIGEEKELELLRAVERSFVTAHSILRRPSKHKGPSETLAWNVYWTYKEEHTNDFGTDIFGTTKGDKTSTDGMSVIRYVDGFIKDTLNASTKIDIKQSCKKLDEVDVVEGDVVPNWGGSSERELVYILYRLSENNDIPVWDDIELEHIRPYSTKDEDEKTLNYVNKFGNLIPLESTLNKKCSNKTLDEKRDYYNQSEIGMANEVYSITKINWNEDNIKDRTEELIRRFEENFKP